MFDTDAIWTSLAETGKAYVYSIHNLIWSRLLQEALEEGVTLERRTLADGMDAIYLRRAR